MKKGKTVPAPLEEAHDKFLLAARSPRWKVKRAFTDDSKSITKIGHLICQIKSELYEHILPSRFTLNGKAPAPCVDVLDVESGEEFMLICNAILASKLTRAGTPLTGRYFEFVCGDTEPGKRYRNVEVNELEEEE